MSLGYCKMTQMMEDAVLDTFSGHLKVFYIFPRPFGIIILDRQGLRVEERPNPPSELERYPDGCEEEDRLWSMGPPEE